MIKLKSISSVVYGTEAGNLFMNPAINTASKHINNHMAACEQDLRMGLRCFHR